MSVETNVSHIAMQELLSVGVTHHRELLKLQQSKEVARIAWGFNIYSISTKSNTLPATIQDSTGNRLKHCTITSDISNPTGIDLSSDCGVWLLYSLFQEISLLLMVCTVLMHFNLFILSVPEPKWLDDKFAF